MQDTNIQYQFFPRSIGLIEPMEEVINVFKKAEDKISSSTNDLKSDDVLSIVRPELEKIGYCVSTCSFRMQQQHRQTFLCRCH